MAGALQIPFYLLGTATSGRYPGDGTLRALHDRELCLNTTDQVLFYTNAAGTLIRMPVNPTLFAMLAGAAFTASPTAPTPTAGDSTTKLATTAFVAAAVAALAPLASPAFTGTPQAPTAAALANSAQLATTAYADKAVAASQARTSVSSGNYQAVLTDRQIAYTALAAASTVTLPPPATFPKGASITLVDEGGLASGSQSITLAPNASEKINGAANYVITAAFGYVQVETNGTNWTIVDSSAFPASAVAALTARTSVADKAYTATTADRLVAYISLTAARVVTLPAASAYPAGANLTVVDESGSCSGTNTITLTPAGSDKINGAASLVMGAARGYVALEAVSGAWTVIDASAIAASNLSPSAPAMNGAAASGTTGLASDAGHVHPVDTSRQAALGFTPVQQGTGTGQGTNTIKLGWNGSNLLAQVDATALGYLWDSVASAFSGGANGYVKLPNGFIIQWGTVTAAGDVAVSFPISFPNAFFTGFGTVAGNGGAGNAYAVTIDNMAVGSFALRPRQISAGAVGGLAGNTAIYWIAIGY